MRFLTNIMVQGVDFRISQVGDKYVVEKIHSTGKRHYYDRLGLAKILGNYMDESELDSIMKRIKEVED